MAETEFVKQKAPSAYVAWMDEQLQAVEMGTE